MQQMHYAKKSIKDSYDNKLVARLIVTEQFRNHSIDHVNIDYNLRRALFYMIYYERLDNLLRKYLER